MFKFILRIVCVPLAAIVVSEAPAQAAVNVSISAALFVGTIQNQGGVKYFSNSGDAQRFARGKQSQGYFTSVLRTNGGQYRVEWWSKHVSEAIERIAATPASGGFVLPSAAEQVEAKYVVWYRKGNERWAGICGVSYYHACRIRDDYAKSGYSVYIEREKRR